MTKGKALILSMVFAATAITSFASREMTGVLAFAAGAILFFSIWLYKYQRDRNIIAQARLRKETAQKLTTPSRMSQSIRSLLPYISQAYVDSLDREAYAKLLANYYQLGTHPETHDALVVSMQDRYSGMYILGSQGGGKSGLMENLAMQDILNNQSVILIDPHGDSIDHLIAQLPDGLPKERLAACRRERSRDLASC